MAYTVRVHHTSSPCSSEQCDNHSAGEQPTCTIGAMVRFFSYRFLFPDRLFHACPRVGSGVPLICGVGCGLLRCNARSSYSYSKSRRFPRTCRVHACVWVLIFDRLRPPQYHSRSMFCSVITVPVLPDKMSSQRTNTSTKHNYVTRQVPHSLDIGPHAPCY